MAGFLSSLTDNLAEGLHRGKCKDCKSSLEYMKANDGLLIINCLHHKKTFEKKFNDLLKRLQNTNKFCDRRLKKFYLTLWKGICPYGYMDGCEGFNETSLSTEI